jgi:hypothetical protein
MAGQQADNQPRRRTAIAEVEHIGRRAQATHANAVDAPFAAAETFHPDAEPSHRFGGGERILRLKQATHGAAAGGKRRKQERAMRNRFVSWNPDVPG